MTIGISPKVALPAIALLALGVALLALGVTLGNDTLTTAGVTLLAAAGIQVPVGARAQPGNVQPVTVAESGSDERLSVDTRARLNMEGVR